MRRQPVAKSAPVSIENDPINVPSMGADLTYMVSRAVGYAALLAFSVFVIAQLV